MLLEEYPFPRVSAFLSFLHHFVLTKLATSSIRVNHNSLEEVSVIRGSDRANDDSGVNVCALLVAVPTR